MEKGLLSVIIPVYQVESYIGECIASVAGQTYQKIEILLIDDGSYDRSGEICDEWSKKDARILVVHQKNKGAGAARNVGLKMANGEYISFVDGDDYLVETMFEHLISLLEGEIDIAECEYQKVLDKTTVIQGGNSNITVFDAEMAMEAHIKHEMFIQLVWNKVYRASIATTVSFPEGKKIDDEFWTYQVIARARKLVHVNEVLYAYRRQAKSVMHTLKEMDRMDMIEAKVKRYEDLKEKMPNLQTAMLNDLWFFCIYQMQGCQGISGENAERVKQRVKEVLRYYPIRPMLGRTKKEKVWLLMARISLSATCRLRNHYKIGK